jgi:lipopolysaccharide/colanic/teichoic acid biosynthesis glycosyltransferase
MSSAAGAQPDSAMAIPCPVVRQPLLKRPLDSVLACIGLVLSAPLWSIAALAVKLEDGGPVFYAQERWGRGGSKFKVYKFRTMVPDADRLFGTVQAAENDRRITRVGRVLRSTGMDELPQLVNILKGEMSLVGPRALAVNEIIRDPDGRVLRYEEIPGFYERLAVRPGLTSLATVYRPKDVHPLEKFHYDLLYVRNQTLWLDLRLIAMSIWISLRGKWETRGTKV